MGWERDYENWRDSMHCGGERPQEDYGYNDNEKIPYEIEDEHNESEESVQQSYEEKYEAYVKNFMKEFDCDRDTAVYQLECAIGTGLELDKDW